MVQQGLTPLYAGRTLENTVRTLELNLEKSFNSLAPVYVDLSSDSAQLSFNFAANPSARWDIKATQVPCNSAARPGPGCFQQHTALTGRITSFNFQNAAEGHLANQE